jgi:hypothetical protein
MEIALPLPRYSPPSSPPNVPMLGELLTRWTIRLALACYVGYVGGCLARCNFSARPIARQLWTAGCGLFVLHVACAFHFYHGWSHAAAFESTARETEALLGVRFGAGIYFSYLFGAVWVLDVGRLWARAIPTASRRSRGPRPLVAAMQGRWPHALVHAYLFFIAFHGAIVFEAGPTRWVGIVACISLAGVGLRRAYNARAAARHGLPREIVHEGRETSLLGKE